MSYQLDEIKVMLDEVLMRLQRIERLVDFSDEDAPEDVREAFDRVFGKSADKPKLFLVEDVKENNVIEFDRNE